MRPVAQVCNRVCRCVSLSVGLLALGNLALADAPSRSLRPVARGQVVAGQVIPSEVFVDAIAEQGEAAARARVQSQPRPQPRTQAMVGPADPPASVRAPAAAPKKERRGLLSLFRPKQRSPAVEDRARRSGAARRQNMICGDPDIQGVEVGRVSGTLKGCLVIDAVRVQSVAGVDLSTHAVMDCQTAKALKNWVDRGLRPAVGQRGGGIAGLRVVAHYSCRTRNSQKGAKLSEHAKGKAIDIAGIKLRDGSEITVLTGWNERKTRKVLHKAHAAACGPFGTVLGPDANRFHRDHFHFDTASYRGGPYCE
ncbi:extensin family protein [Pseudooceanicola sp.]|uniref:extensin-like domain-containing protein n=1 Tax=Pseudooceanicola sp. TaxID=1914328 RepID=UPI0026323839|nr:extensin family protein [Pseudooceanicola sp.]MDF1854484.1 extensin family protein [Pseudooceanicola sp.]